MPVESRTPEVDNSPVVSVLLPVYEPNIDWLRGAIKSVLEQTYSDFELVVVDDGSKTPVAESLDDLVQKEGNVKTFRQENKGFAGATNQAFQESEGQYVAFIAQDDFWEPEKLERQMEYVEQGYDAVFSRAFVINEEGERIGQKGEFPEEDRFRQLFFGSYPIYESALLDRALVDGDLLDESFTVAADWDLWFRIWPDARIGWIDAHLVTKRRHSEKTSVQHFKELIEEDEYIIKKYTEIYDTDDDLRQEALTRFYRAKGIRLYRRGNVTLARELWRKASELGNGDILTRSLLWLSWIRPLWMFAFKMYSRVTGTNIGEPQI